MPIANIKQIAEYRHRVTLFARPQQFTDRNVQRLTEQIEQGGLQRGDGIDAQLKRPGAFAEGVKVRRLVAFVNTLDHFIQTGDLLADHLRNGV